jgi:prepilin-type N-terminal cleavage/methylation domain-containing protein
MKKLGFTLAEVLLTLTIIGVVAALTVPNLMGAIDERELQAQAKKAYNTIQNAVSMQYALTRLSPADYGQFVILQNLLAGNASHTIKYTEADARFRIVQLPDGQVMGVPDTTSAAANESCNVDTTNACAIIVDVNGVDGPTFSGVRSGTSAAGMQIIPLPRTQAPKSKTQFDKTQRDIVYFKVNGLSVTPWVEHGVTRRYFTDQK